MTQSTQERNKEILKQGFMVFFDELKKEERSSLALASIDPDVLVNALTAFAATLLGIKKE